MTRQQSPRKISAIRYCDPIKVRRQTSPLVALAAVTATALAIALLVVTVGYAQTIL